MTAHAAPSRKVVIESDPAGAKVYLNDQEAGPVCDATPCTIDVPVGETPLIVDLAGYSPSISLLEITAGRAPIHHKVKLVAAPGGIDAKILAGAKSATVKIDDQDRGRAPVRVPIPPGSHRVQYVVDGKVVYDEQIDVAASPDYTVVTPKLAPAPDGDDGAGAGGSAIAHGNGSGSASRGSDDGSDDEPPPPPPVADHPHFSVLGLLDFGFRQYAYDHATTSNLSPESESGEILIGPAVDVYPTAWLAPGKLPGLALALRFEAAIHNNDLSGDGITGAPSTAWVSAEATIRYRWPLRDVASIAAEIGYVNDRFSFNATDHDRALLPDADYQSIKFGVRGALSLGRFEPFLDLENRVVVAGGVVSSRFDHASTDGLHGELGIGYRNGRFSARVAGILTRYASTFSNDNATTATFNAAGATDTIEVISIAAGYAY